MTRLIDADTLKETIAKFHQNENDRLHNPVWGSISLNALNRLIDYAPTVEVPKKGKWIVAKQDCYGIHEIECPFCKYNKGKDFNSFITITFDVFPPFCEKCGADLRGEEE